MSVLFMDGFDFGGNYLDGLDNGFPDYGRYWGGGTLGGPRPFVDGFNTAGRDLGAISGNASGTVGIGTLSTSVDYPSSGKCKVGCWMKLIPPNIAGGFDALDSHAIFGVGPGNSTDHFVCLALAAADTGTDGQYAVRVAKATTFNPMESDLTVLGVADQPVDDVNWHHWEIALDWVLGTVVVKRNGSVVFSDTDSSLVAAGTALNDTLGVKLVGKATYAEAQYCVAYDHLYLTDGSEVIGVPVAAVSVSGSVNCSNPAALSLGLRAFLRMGVTKYDHPDYDTQAVGASNVDGAAHEVYWLFPENPETSADWGATALTDIDNWGFCIEPTADARIVHLFAAGLQLLKDVNGLPQIVTYPPPGAVDLAGDWTKSDPDRTVAEHISDIPRSDPDVEATNLYMFGNGGCIQWPVGERTPPLGLFLAEEFDINHEDFETLLGLGADYDSFFISGYKLAGEGSKDFQSNYVHIHSKAISNGSAFFQGIWDYADDPNSGRWSTKQQVYRLAPAHFSDLIAKLKVRGHGKVLQFKVSSEAGKPFRVNGWAVFVTGNTTP